MSSTEIQRQEVTRKRVIGERVTLLAESPPPQAGPEAVFARLAELADWRSSLRWRIPACTFRKRGLMPTIRIPVSNCDNCAAG
ncbi:hypothetical protein ASD28_05460 [Massilia sp. Root133]|nr:hypothetical protein ASD28_05460 [Massilia sp. Root133]